MCTHHSPGPHRDPLHCILPPHILEHLARHGSAHHRQWAIKSLTQSARLHGRREVLSRMLGIFPSGGDVKRRTIFNAQEGEDLPGVVVRREGDPPSADVAVNEAYDGAGATYDFYKEQFNRNSLDDNGMRLDSTVHYSDHYDNAFFDGKQMVYGDGDGQLFKRFTIAVDVIGHELTHGVTAFSAGLLYRDQPGALNESISDVFGSLVKQYQTKQSAQDADWLIGAGLLADGIHGVALRSMKAPGTAYDDPVLGKDPQPAHMKDFVRTTSDNGGVHINSGIPNHAFFLVATALGGNAWERAGRIWYAALKQFSPETDFHGAAQIIVQTARTLFKPGSTEEKAVIEAWQNVGIAV
ncbi:MAG: M4 family metallopeptidase [Verrucomicrobia bacterium]|nr:M4 family metallopeptidase [Verrucomicrobiota bacterium]